MGVVLVRDGGLGSGSCSSERWRTGKWEMEMEDWEVGVGSGSCSSERWRTGEWELF